MILTFFSKIFPKIPLLTFLVKRMKNSDNSLNSQDFLGSEDEKPPAAAYRKGSESMANMDWREAKGSAQ
jgi:hypothetical protein